MPNILKTDFIDSHLDFFSANCAKFCNVHEERFHQGMFVIEQRYQGKWTAFMLTYISRENQNMKYKQKSK